MQPWHRWPKELRAPDGPLRLAIYARTNGRCSLNLEGCTTKPTTLDHIVRPEAGGAWFDPINLRGACRNCNSSRGRTPNGLSNPAPGW